MAIELDIRLVPIPGIPKIFPIPSPLGLLAPLVGTWTGKGFNQIFRPQQPGLGLDNFLELNLTNETLQFTEIPGEIPNRGLLQQDISLFGMTYLQQVADANVKDTNGNPAGIHIEPGIWLNIPSTTNPQEQGTVARLANIPHGTSLVAQGTATVIAGAPVFPAVDITPFSEGNPSARIPFPSQSSDLTKDFPNRSPASDIVGIDKAMVGNPNSLLEGFLAGKTISSHTRIQISTFSFATLFPPPNNINPPLPPNPEPNAGGGTSNIAFLVGSLLVPPPAGRKPDANANANAVQMDATFWISSVAGLGQILQYSQVVLLNFNGLSWPHVSVANLVQPVIKIKEGKEIKEKEISKDITDHKHVGKEAKDSKSEVKEVEFPMIAPKPDPGHAGPAAAAPTGGQHFITPAERPAVGEPPKEPPKKP
jgi:hypothetical protein